ncbi:MAG: hypothetical protein QOI63_294, partial [Thermoplasmata archaeon]|nr:hypothetical protein [Thermoplasmata archaeon]
MAWRDFPFDANGLQTPIVASWAGGRADVFALSTSSPVMKHWWWSQGANALSGPEVVQAGTLMRGAVAVSWGPNRLDVLAIGDDHTL